MRLFRILILGFVLWLLFGAMPECGAVCRTGCDAELSATDSSSDRLRSERLYNSDFDLVRLAAEVAPQPVIRLGGRAWDAAARPVLKYGAVCRANPGTVYAFQAYGSEGIFVCGSAVDHYVYRFRRLII